MNALAGHSNVLVWHRFDHRWGQYVGPAPDDPASTCYVVWAVGGDPVRENTHNLLVAEHPSAGQVEPGEPVDPGTTLIEVHLGESDDPGQVLWYVPGRRPENRRAEAFAITQKLVGAGLAGWAEAHYGGDEPALTGRKAHP